MKKEKIVVFVPKKANIMGLREKILMASAQAPRVREGLKRKLKFDRIRIFEYGGTLEWVGQVPAEVVAIEITFASSTRLFETIDFFHFDCYLRENTPVIATMFDYFGFDSQQHQRSYPRNSFSSVETIYTPGKCIFVGRMW